MEAIRTGLSMVSLRPRARSARPELPLAVSVVRSKVAQAVAGWTRAQPPSSRQRQRKSRIIATHKNLFRGLAQLRKRDCADFGANAGPASAQARSSRQIPVPIAKARA